MKDTELLEHFEETSKSKRQLRLRQDILNSILPPREWTQEDQLWVSPGSLFRLICGYGVGFVGVKDSLTDSEVQYVSSTPATRWEHN